ncbi:MAG: AbrB/MazE/SpoVT family DNA-binding domain-containing protein [Deltaproteobacteria bacterium]|nr:AbrB/MazE/SpoVT family DNA-binding domain-containing protein [Deltaproteobacteria bacterium]
MPSATLSSKGQVTIPKAVRELLRVGTGDRVQFLVREDGVVELHPETVDLLSLVGILEPRDDRHVSVKQMNEAVERASAKAAGRAQKS